MKLTELLNGIHEYKVIGDTEKDILAIAYDSRKVRPGTLFVAMKGAAMDGHAFIRDAVQRGASAVVLEEAPDDKIGIPVIRVPDSRRALSLIALEFYRRPFQAIDLIGITGTNGKTTSSFLLESILLKAGKRPGVIGTINYRYAGCSRPASVTTPESMDLIALAREMADASTTHIIMEVSSHALVQGRTSDCVFRTAVFTNLSRDHLDYHMNMEEYFMAKSLLFKELGRESTAVINMDDSRGQVLAAMTKAKTITYGIRGRWDVRMDAIQMDKYGIKAELVTPSGRREIHSSLIGEFNIYNILAASSAALSLGVEIDAIAGGIESLAFVPGRMEAVRNCRDLTVVVDYAHTPDALQKALLNLRPCVQGRLITVFGCGGDRDRGKRAEMGLIAGRESDLAFITSDNPRSEDPLSIVLEIEQGIIESGMKKLETPLPGQAIEKGYFTEPNRREAIRKAISIATKNDLVLIAGKGHEDYQIIGCERRHFDDRKEAALAAMEAAA